MSVEVVAQVGDGEGDMPALRGHYTSVLRLVNSRGPLGLSRACAVAMPPRLSSSRWVLVLFVSAEEAAPYGGGNILSHFLRGVSSFVCDLLPTTVTSSSYHCLSLSGQPHPRPPSACHDLADQV